MTLAGNSYPRGTLASFLVIGNKVRYIHDGRMQDEAIYPKQTNILTLKTGQNLNQVSIG